MGKRTKRRPTFWLLAEEEAKVRSDKSEWFRIATTATTSVAAAAATNASLLPHESEGFFALAPEARRRRGRSRKRRRMHKSQVIKFTEAKKLVEAREKRLASMSDKTTKSRVRALVALCHLTLCLATLFRAPAQAELVRFSAASQGVEASFSPTRAPPKYAASEPRSARANELDVFLDDINQSELRAIAQGKPIGAELFRPKLLATAQSEPQRKHEQVEPREKEVDQSGSEQQLYSECALILQRTYVKNINDPK